MNTLLAVGRRLANRLHTPSVTDDTTPAEVHSLTRYVNRDAIQARTGPGSGHAAIGQLFYLDRGVNLREDGGWVLLRLRYRSASGLPAGTTAWIPKACTTPCSPLATS
ncbi:hypothetical protein ACFWP3_09935 [Streptomyces sp. NPDC058525]|uniref:hypothetical protein n=1 Tax=Streptomyces sp. NPDC058525 TaxID=3346538 RepID=UPI0036663AE4